MDNVKVVFPNGEFAPLILQRGDRLAERLTVQNSPILFGCRTGLCGTCLVRVRGNIPPATAAELEVLDILAPDDPHARLACQIELTADIEISPYEI